MTTVAFNTSQKPEMTFSQIEHARDEEDKTSFFAITFFAGIASLFLLPPPMNFMAGLALIVLSLPMGGRAGRHSDTTWMPAEVERDPVGGRNWGWGPSWSSAPFFGGGEANTGGFSDGWFSPGHQQPGSTQTYPPQSQRRRDVDTEVVGERDPVGPRYAWDGTRKWW